MSSVRDETIEHWEMIADGRMKDEESQEIHARLAGMSSSDREFTLELVPQIVDTVVHNLLTMLEQEEDVIVTVKLRDAVSPNLREISDGLAGELYSDKGWIIRYSRF